ncbi:MAG TPA: TonB-dependent receptor [Bacteroidales bacterium]|mgnify:FL=1|nr:TonB-dependent receptor [Bacteroidales bacterium]
MMKESPFHEMQLFRHLKKPFWDIKILILALLLGAGTTFAGAVPQQLTVSGTVTDLATGDPMPGVNIVVKGTVVGTLSGPDGKYSLAVTGPNDILVFSFIGYNSLEVALAGRTTLNVELESATTELDEVIVTGYGTQKKSDLTGSVVRVTMDDKASLANMNISQALSGATAGVNVQGSGLAGTEPDLSIRGQTSLSASDRPLIVLDGIIFNGAISDINVSDVESIDILKDASAAAVYGSRSANGVMLITTKRGKSAKPVVSFNMYYGYQDMTNNPMRVMNAQEYAVRLVDYYYQQDLYSWYKTKPTGPEGKPVRPDVNNKELVAARLRTQEERDNYMAGNEIDWVDEITHIAPIQNYNINVSGKTTNSNYYVSGSYTNEEGILRNDKYSRFTLHSNLESKITDWFTLSVISSYSYRDYSGLNADLGHARSCSPLANNKIGQPVWDMYLTGEAYMPYPLNNLYVTNEDKRNSLFMVGSGKITVPWVKGLTYELNYSNTFLTRTNNSFYPVTVPGGAGNKGRAYKLPEEERNWIVNNIVTYLRSFGQHQINATLLYSAENRNFQSSSIDAQGFDNPVLGFNNVSLGTQYAVASSAWEENSLSYMARLNYTFMSRYLLTATWRRDGFSGFGPDKKFANFPSVSLGWVLSDESFTQSIPKVYLKLRTSYGENGNQGIGRYSSFSRMTADAYVFGPTTSVAVYPSTLGNASLAWEKTASLNVGIDFGFLDRRISGSIDVYKAKTSDVLVSRALPPTTGYASVWTNIGAIDNKGIELELNTINLTGQLGWETNFVFSLNRDKISRLYGDKNDKDIGNSWFVGEPISAIYDYEMMGGLWTEADLYAGRTYDNWYPGQYKYVDQNNDGVIEPNNDRKVIGYRSPSYRFSINNTFNWKNFTFSFFINSIQGGKKYYQMNNASVVNVDWRSDNVLRINASAVRPYWTPENGVNNATGVYNSPAVSSGIYESRSFVRLQDVSLAYRFNQTVLSKLDIEALQVYIASKNPYVWTKWSGWDPETGTSNSPLMRNITAGFRVTF